ncbi:sprT-like domain-containing protein Spartan [Dendronephthya gigantea]|uniref:sprT-like domain-containing protein Spartan n=1 Tax=Dendronephthya gigantea TaxID=151771 RepID=UPI00106B1EE4|nr:sprT-like domain-containing protein Spartan [Dendronephthya gigantea]
MIHAYLFVTNNNKDHNAHGPEFHKHMNRINKQSGANITVRHNFHDEVKFYRRHKWRCDGPCQHRPPYYGVVRRATDRAPSQHDHWWSDHQRTCGGTYHKDKNFATDESSETVLPTGLQFSNKDGKSRSSSKSKKENQRVGSSTRTVSKNERQSNHSESQITIVDSFKKIPLHVTRKTTPNATTKPPVPVVVIPDTFVKCPVCRDKVEEDKINTHLDDCLLP